ncbi:MAG: FAD-binding protein [Lentisphaeria bacterium]|nr:FAD-binding protein [Lentisphaeria bacterium]
MTQVPQEILDSLTKVKMPSGVLHKEINGTIDIDGITCPIYTAEAIVLGSGAAGLRAACEMKRAGVDVIVASQSLYGGTSACSGSDKQTLHTAGTSNNGDNFNKLAQDIGSGGAMDLDTAYIEATGSIGAFSGLQYLGLPLPQDRFGAVLRYQTDHDEVGRATSCGPRTSRLMVKVLAEEAIRLNIPFLSGSTGIQILKQKVNGKETTCGVICIDRNEENEYGLSVVLADKVVLATGGPGEMYRDSVYPKHCFGSLGMAIEAGIDVTNLTESQFGIGTRRQEFPWNLSGTYVQVIPYIFSRDDQGNEYNFLGDYFRTTQELASNVFRKGYQWPFHATRMLDYKSSLVDLAIFIESRKGRTILMDFNRNPLPVPGDQEFSLERLDEDVRTYLENNEALQEMPIDRLLQMNPLSIELYKMHNHDLNVEPLPFDVNNQHMNGGIDVDIWSQSSLDSCYAVGEVAGTHGVTRPGGAALNAGQVFGMRCAKHIANSGPKAPNLTEIESVKSQVLLVIANIRDSLKSKSALNLPFLSENVQSRMSDKAGFICHADEIQQALQEAKDLNKTISTEGISISEHREIARLFQWRQTAISSEAVLTALNHYADQGGGSRGARAICSSNGTTAPATRLGPLEEFRFIEEKDDDKSKKIVLTYQDGDFSIKEKQIRKMESPSTIFFEKNWANYLTDRIYEDGFRHT